MTNLTEQWKKGELPKGWYYVKDIHNEERLDRYFKETDNFEYLEDWEVGEVLAKVPSYEEWQEYKDANDSMFDTIKMLNKDNYKLENENTKLKKLLKEANNWLKAFYAYEQSDFVREQVKQCLTKISQVLGEE